MTKRQITALLMLVAAILLGAWDWIVAHNTTKGDTISEITRDISLTIYTLPYACGIVMGHLFWNAPDRKRLNLKVIVWSTVGVLAYDALSVPFMGGNLVFFFTGILMGAYFWPQKDSHTSVSEV